MNAFIHSFNNNNKRPLTPKSMPQFRWMHPVKSFRWNIPKGLDSLHGDSLSFHCDSNTQLTPQKYIVRATYIALNEVSLQSIMCFILFSSFPLLLAFVVGGLGFEFCVFVAGWRHALRSEWPFIIIIIMYICHKVQGLWW